MQPSAKEIDISGFFYHAAPMDYSASQAELGPSAAADTWRAATDDANEYPLLTTAAHLEAARAFIRSSGFSEDVDTMPDDEIRALVLQSISGDMREAGINRPLDDSEPFDWIEYQRRSEAGNLAGRFYQGDDGKVYYYLGV